MNKQNSLQIDWSNYSKSTAAVALDITFNDEGFKTKWKEHNNIPYVCYTFWAGDESKEIKPKYVPNFKGNWKKSLFIRPEIESQARELLKLSGECHTWDKAVVETINDWIKYGTEMSVNRLEACKRRLKDAAIRDAKEAERKRNEPEEEYTCEESEQRIA